MASDFGEMADRISKFRKSWKDGISDVTLDAVQQMEKAVTRQVANNDSMARPELINLIDVDPNRATEGDALIAASVEAPSWSRYVEYGTGPRGRERKQPNDVYYPAPDPGPPYDAILQWVLNKNITPVEYDSKYGLAGAIQETIAEQGQIPRPFMRPIWYDKRRGYRSVLTANHRELKRQLRRL